MTPVPPAPTPPAPAPASKINWREVVTDGVVVLAAAEATLNALGPAFSVFHLPAGDVQIASGVAAGIGTVVSYLKQWLAATSTKAAVLMGHT